jgi:cell division protein FtsI/penicillin-binding protein 2
MKNIKYIIIVINIIIVIRIIYISIINSNYYKAKQSDILDKYITTNYAPRGRILDRSGNILVDNKSINVLVFRNYNFTDIELSNIITKISNLIDIDIYTTDNMRREYYYFLNKDNINKKIDNNIYNDYKLNKITSKEYYNYKLSLIGNEDIASIDDKCAYIYYLVTNGYNYDDKIIKYDLSEYELTSINEANIDGLRCEIYYERIYNYDTSLNQIFGSVGKITSEKLDYYLNKGYKVNDIVGISFLEEYYDDYLRGTPRKYKINSDNSITLVEDYEKGNDLVLSIDINLQLQIESILKKEIIETKKYPSSKYYNGSYITLSDNLGCILAMAGYKYDNSTFINDAIGNITNSYTVGSVVKGASQSVAFINGVIDTNTKLLDSCVKLYANGRKCSWKSLGLINDIDALAYSSNYYQFINAIKVSGYNYTYNMKFNPTDADFEKYRTVFRQYGLGSDTGIEISGYKGITGSMISGDLLLNLSIGQYDTYTPIMLNSYINTLGNNGIRYNMSFGSYILDNDGNKIMLDKSIIDQVSIDEESIKRIQEGFLSVIKKGTGRSYLNSNITGAGKTGTSETSINGHNTLTKSFILYFPYETHEYNLTIVSPNLVDSSSKNSYIYPINSRLSRQITNILFEN